MYRQSTEVFLWEIIRLVSRGSSRPTSHNEYRSGKPRFDSCDVENFQRLLVVVLHRQIPCTVVPTFYKVRIRHFASARPIFPSRISIKRASIASWCTRICSFDVVQTYDVFFWQNIFFVYTLVGSGIFVFLRVLFKSHVYSSIYYIPVCGTFQTYENLLKTHGSVCMYL